MARRRRTAGRAGESLFGILAFLSYYTYEKLIKYPLLASLIFGLIVSLIVIAVLLISRARRIRRANLLARDSMYLDYSPDEFERLTADIFRLQGYKAKVTPHSGDKGIDVILTSNNNSKIGIQCKRYREDIKIGPVFIREFIGALEGKKLDQGIFVTTSEFTEASKEDAKNSRREIVLINGEKLGEMRNKAERRINTDLIPQHWWGIMSTWQKGLLIALFLFCVMLVVGTISYIAITAKPLNPLAIPTAISGGLSGGFLLMGGRHVSPTPE